MNPVCIVTAYTPQGQWKELGSMSVSTMREYANRHGLDLRVFTEGFDESRDFTWSKIPFIKKVLPEYEWVWWLDSDTAIANHTKTIDEFLKLDADVVIGEDTGKDIRKDILCNGGSFFIRNCPFSLWLLDEIWKREDLAKKAWHEQEALADLYRSGKCQGRVKLVPFRELNGYCDWHAERHHKIPNEELQWHVGDFIAHCAGYWMPHRIEILKEVVGLTIR